MKRLLSAFLLSLALCIGAYAMSTPFQPPVENAPQALSDAELNETVGGAVDIYCLGDAIIVIYEDGFDLYCSGPIIIVF